MSETNIEEFKELRVKLSSKMYKMLEEIMKKEGLVSLAESARFLIRERYKQMKEIYFEATQE